jgi:hypothetical protein
MRPELTQMDSQSSKPAENLLYSNPMPWAAHLFFSPRLRRTSDVYLWLAEMSVEQFDLQPRSWLRSETSHSRSEPKTMTVTTTFAKTLSLIPRLQHPEEIADEQRTLEAPSGRSTRKTLSRSAGDSKSRASCQIDKTSQFVSGREGSRYPPRGSRA